MQPLFNIILPFSSLLQGWINVYHWNNKRIHPLLNILRIFIKPSSIFHWTFLNLHPTFKKPYGTFFEPSLNLHQTFIKLSLNLDSQLSLNIFDPVFIHLHLQQSFRPLFGTDVVQKHTFSTFTTDTSFLTQKIASLDYPRKQKNLKSAMKVHLKVSNDTAVAKHNSCRF